jgi:hypothetical protein
MMKLFVSQPMKGKTEAEIRAARDDALRAFREENGAFRLIDTFFAGYDGNRLQFLGKSVSEGLALADAALFIGDWKDFDGCACEHFIAKRYGVPCYYYK